MTRQNSTTGAPEWYDSTSATWVQFSQQTSTSPNTFGFKNRFINAGMQISQRATSATVTAGTGVPTSSTGYPCVDRWFVYSTGANVTAAQVAGSSTTQNRLQITGAASVTAVGVGQRIEANNSYDLNGQVVTLSVDMANSVLTSVTWTASYATTANTFGTIGTPTKTQIATGTFTVNSTVTNYKTQITVPSAATTGIEVLFTVGAQTSGTWTIGNPQIELGSTATSFDFRSYSTELALCQRYLPAYAGPNATEMFMFGTQYSNTTNAYVFANFPVFTRVAPTGVSVSNATHFRFAGTNANMTMSSIAFGGSSTSGGELALTGTGGSSLQGGALQSVNAAALFYFTGCEL
jgi:hypothetical protein